MLTWVIEMFNNSVSNATDMIAQSPQVFSNGLYVMVETINKALTPLAIGLLVTYFIFSFYEKAVTFKMQDYKLFATEVIQLVMGITILSNNLKILEMFYWISNTVLKKVQIETTSPMLIDVEVMNEMFEDVSIWSDAGLWLESAFIKIILIISLLSVVFIVSFVVISRMFEIYIYLGLAPLAMCSFVNETTRPIFKGYITNFASVVLKGAIFVFIIQMYQVYISDSITTSLAEGELYPIQIAISALILITLLMGAEKISKTIVGSLK